LYRPPGLLLEHDGPPARHSGRNHIANAKRHDVAAPQPAIDRQVKQRQVADTSFNLQANPNAPNMHQPEWKLGA
jgi:hypothetical protein